VRVLLTGGGGILGTALQKSRPASVELTVTRRAQLDVTDRAGTLAAIAAARPDVVIHAAAMTDVDGCEGDPERAFRCNWLGTANVVDACARVAARPLCLSTDYVFDGTKSGDYLEHDPTGPQSVYGTSKRFGEIEALRNATACVVRTQWVFGAGGRNFVDTMLKLGPEKKSLKVVDDQRGCPTWSNHLAQGLWRLLAADEGPGIWHLSARGACSWYEFAQAIFREARLDVAVTPCTTAEFPRPARRPRNGVLRNYRLALSLGDFMPPWEEGLRGYLQERRGPAS
jgi:dTDP-4-dehydrorhamnose reductase